MKKTATILIIIITLSTFAFTGCKANVRLESIDSIGSIDSMCPGGPVDNISGISIKGFSIITGSIPGMKNIEAYDPSDPVKTGAAIDILEEVISRYPAELSKRAGIEAIFICEGLKSFDIPTPAATSPGGEGKSFIYVDASAVRRIDVSFTHELFHALEYEVPIDEGAWAQINPYEHYLRDLASPGDIVRYEPNKIPAFEPGFVSDYARFSGMEDRAELFTMLYSGRELSAKERAALRSDSFLMEKITFLKKYLEESGLSVEGMRDNLLSVDTRYTCRAYILIKPELALAGPNKAYPDANLKAGQLLADSGYEEAGMKMLYYENNGSHSRVYVPLEALELLDDETIEIELL